MYQMSQIDMAKKTTKLQTHTATLFTLLPRMVQKNVLTTFRNVANWFWCPLQLGALSDRQTRPPVIRPC